MQSNNLPGLHFLTFFPLNGMHGYIDTFEISSIQPSMAFTLTNRGLKCHSY